MFTIDPQVKPEGKTIEKRTAENDKETGRRLKMEPTKYTPKTARCTTPRKVRNRVTQLENNTNLVGGYKALAKKMGLGK